MHIKSTTKFKVLIGFSALAISGVAALFSVTGVSSLFAGAFWAIVAMMGILEFGKIVVASYLARFWYDLSSMIKVYFIAAVIVLMAITSAGIFGYLSDAYQKTRGDYTIVEGQTKVLETKRNFFLNRKERLEKDKLLEVHSKESNQTRADSLTSRNQSITRTRQDIKTNETKITLLENQISANEDSIGYYDTRIIDAKSINIKGELGPLRFIADAFGTEMDQVVKYLMLMLIFVFDPLAVLLFVSLSTMIRKDAEKEKPLEEEKGGKEKMEEQPFERSTDPYDGIRHIIDSNDIEYIAEETEPLEKEPEPKSVDDHSLPNYKQEAPISDLVFPKLSREVIDQIDQNLDQSAKNKKNKKLSKKVAKISIKEEVNREKKKINPVSKNEDAISSHTKKDEDEDAEHEFYYGSGSNVTGSVEVMEVPKMEVTQSTILDIKPEPVPTPEPQKAPTAAVAWYSANSPKRFGN